MQGNRWKLAVCLQFESLISQMSGESRHVVISRLDNQDSNRDGHLQDEEGVYSF